MDDSTRQPDAGAAAAIQSPAVLEPSLAFDQLRLRRWFGIFVLLMAGMSAALAAAAASESWTWRDWVANPPAALAATVPTVKLLFMLLYVSLACTFLPLPTGWVIAGVATCDNAIAAGWSDNPLVVGVLTTLVVAAVGAAGSTVANLNDYHLMTLMFRSRWIARVRHTRAYLRAVEWFQRSPFFLLVVFNLLPLPVDVVRILASSHRYGRLPFAAANFIGRFFRYAIIAGATFWVSIKLPDKQWVPSAVLLGAACVMGLAKAVSAGGRRLRPSRESVRP